ncbi:MAG: sporulation protein YqfC [Paenibacillus dendritiformis]|uniref:sporulation protein YqfC n=1 Tax=Paenibacillus dendritiformis TaxID=130049 RepID=UPI00143CD5DD|nr:sporulation protein YqfC [Paenibacillus dendritiformis]MDU5143101.1 sporulation protein YqfC [Paenibacillus dendritiformis]NKI20803.1 sporulation protein YqfC [Paenibacillus dendritiformis]NRF96719.1 sporulation protein YqfC [Paenibacillus dendritiformis]GIO72341.1 hypothetical protein J27TS7_18550 [Paenibacillus dendritiformis]
MSRIARKLRQWSVNWFDLPQDMITDMPRLVMTGNRKLVVENHQGILHFSDQHMRLALAAGQLEVYGTGLTIRAIYTEEICIEGVINDIKYHGTGGTS